MNLLSVKPPPPKSPPKSPATRIVWTPKPQDELRQPEPRFRDNAVDRATHAWLDKAATRRHEANAEVNAKNAMRHARMHQADIANPKAIMTAEAATDLSYALLFVVHATSRGVWSERRERFYAALRASGFSYPEIAALCGTTHSTVIGALIRYRGDSTIRANATQ